MTENDKPRRLSIPTILENEDPRHLRGDDPKSLNVLGLKFPEDNVGMPKNPPADHLSELTNAEMRLLKSGRNVISQGPSRDHIQKMAAKGKGAKGPVSSNPAKDPVEEEKNPVSNIHLLRKPKGWPEIMAWPPAALVAAGKKRAFTKEELKSTQAYYDILGARTEEHRGRLDQWFLNFEKSNHHRMLMRRRMEINREKDGYEQGDIKWASLLDVTASSASSHQNVVTWGRDTCELSDGGVVQALSDEIRVVKGSKNVAALMVGEAKARGWDSLKVEGTPKFCEAIIEAAMAAKLPAEVTVVKRVMGIPFRKTIFVTPDVPFDMEEIEKLKEAASLAMKGDVSEEKEILRKAREDDRRSMMSPEEKHAEDMAAEAAARNEAERISRSPDAPRRSPEDASDAPPERRGGRTGQRRRKEGGEPEFRRSASAAAAMAAAAVAADLARDPGPQQDYRGDPGPQPDDRGDPDYGVPVGYDEAYVPLGYDEPHAPSGQDDDLPRMG